MVETKSDPDQLGRTTLRAYRYIFRRSSPVGIHEIQRALGLASSSTAHYHVQKLLGLGLIRMEGNGFVADKRFMENYVRIRRTAFPIQGSLIGFYVVTLVILITIARPSSLTSGYAIGILACLVALGSSIVETLSDFRKNP